MSKRHPPPQPFAGRTLGIPAEVCRGGMEMRQDSILEYRLQDLDGAAAYRPLSDAIRLIRMTAQQAVEVLVRWPGRGWSGGADP